MSGAILLPNANAGRVTGVTAGDASISVGGTAAAPTIETGTLDQIAALHPPAAAVAMNGQKITGQAAGTASTDSANVGQVPALVSGRYLCSPTVYAPAVAATPSTTSSTFSAIDTGVICTGYFTAPASGEVIVIVTLVGHASAAVQCGFALANVGSNTLVAPAYLVDIGPTVTPAQQYTFAVTGLTAGNTYNFDVLYAIVSSDTLTVTAFGDTSSTLSGGNIGGPVTVTTQAV
jgi:hypothetical protein